MGNAYWICQSLAVILPSLCMMVYFAWATKNDTKMRRFAAVIGLGLFYPLMVPIAITLRKFPKNYKMEKEDPQKRTNRLIRMEMVLSNILTAMISWIYMSREIGSTWEENFSSLANQQKADLSIIFPIFLVSFTSSFMVVFEIVQMVVEAINEKRISYHQARTKEIHNEENQIGDNREEK